MGSRAKWGACLTLTLAAVLTAATFAQAVDQTSKNGCVSDVAYESSLTSPPYTPASSGPADPPTVSLQGWFEVESINPSFRDEIILEYSLPDESTFNEFGRMSPAQDPPNGRADLPFSNAGLSVTPAFEPFNFTLPIETLGVAGVQVRVRFASGDGNFQGFRGVGIDEVSLEGTGTATFEGSLDGWTPDPAGPGDPVWQPIADSQNVTVKNPEVNPDLVTLPDSGALPPAADGVSYAWFGNTASGTYCGPDFASRDAAPDTSITSAPPASTASNDATFRFTSSEAAFFQCQLDGGGFTPCGSPQTYSSLPEGPHTFAVQAIDFTGNVDPTPATHAWTIRPATLADLDDPTLGVDVNVQKVRGTVLVGLRSGAARAAGSGRASQKGISFVPLSEAQQIPVGSFLDTRRGTVRLQSAMNRRGKRQTGNFLKGLFQVRQSRRGSARGLTDLILKGASFRRCRAGRGKGATASLSRRRVRRLRANARGRFRTRGRNSSATVRGTIWDITDRCDGTLTKVRRGKVVVRDFRRKRNITLTSGKSYLAKAPR